MVAARIAVVCVMATVAPSWAAAQKPERGGKAKASAAKKKKAAAKEAAKPDAASADDGGAPSDSPLPSDAPEGAQENPRAPVTEFDEVPRPKVEAKAPPVPTTYPTERVLRPLTLHRRMAEVSLDAPSTFNPYVLSGLLGARYGITRQIQAGLRYGTGTLSDGEYFAGKAFSVDVEYQVFPWLAGQVSVPMLVDPFAAGVTIGAPMKFLLIDRLRVDLFRDFITFKVSRFAPSVSDAAFNDAQVATDEINGVLDDGEINLNAGVAWQWKPDLAVEGRYGLKARDFDFRSDSPMMFDVGLIYTSNRVVDIGGRLGFADLNDTDTSFGFWLLAALRI
jgi:hypothetical protein